MNLLPHRRCAALVAAVTLAVSLPLAAQVPAAPAPLAQSLTGQAQADYESGKLLYGDGDYSGAYVKFQGAYQTSKDPRLLWNMAACEKGMRHYARVIRLLRQYLAEGVGRISDDDRKEAQELLSTIEQFTVALTLVVKEPGAEITVDGESVGTSPLPAPVVVDIGTRVVTATKPGFKPLTQSLPVGGAPGATVTLTLVREVHEGALTVHAPAGSTITIDGKAVGTGTYTGTLSSGGHTLRVDAESMRSYQSEVVIQDGEKRTVDVALEPMGRGGATEEPTGPLHGFELGLRTGYGREFRNGSVGYLPLWLDIGYRLGAPTYLGVYAQAATMDRSGTCGNRRHGPNPDGPLDAQVRYGYTSCMMGKAGVAFIIHFLPRTIVDPFFGIDVGANVTLAAYRSYDPVLGTTANGHDNNGSIQPGVQLGLDVHPKTGFAVGVFGQAGPEFGGEGKIDSSNQTSPILCQPNTPCSNNDSGKYVTGHIMGGVRVGYTFQ